MPRAKEHLRVSHDQDDPDVFQKLLEATGIITDYLGTQADPAWNEDTTPWHVQAAVLLVLGHLYENRGNDLKMDADLWGAIERLLRRSRDPAIA